MGREKYDENEMESVSLRYKLHFMRVFFQIYIMFIFLMTNTKITLNEIVHDYEFFGFLFLFFVFCFVSCALG